MAVCLRNPSPRPNDPVSAADFAQLVRMVRRLSQSSVPRGMVDGTGSHARDAGRGEPLWAVITGYDEVSGQYSWQEQHFNATAAAFEDKPGGRGGVGGGSKPAFESNARADVPAGTVVRLERVRRAAAFVFDGTGGVVTAPLNCADQNNVLSVVTDITCNGDGTITVTKTDICVKQVQSP